MRVPQGSVLLRGADGVLNSVAGESAGSVSSAQWRDEFLDAGYVGWMRREPLVQPSDGDTCAGAWCVANGAVIVDSTG